MEEGRHSRDSQPYPNYAEDHDPMPTGTPKENEQAIKSKLKQYSQGIFSAYKRSKVRGELLWSAFITAFGRILLEVGQELL